MIKTIEITGLGRIYVPIDAPAHITLCAAVIDDSTIVNARMKRVSRAQRHDRRARETDAAGYYLRRVRDACFVLVSPRTE